MRRDPKGAAEPGDPHAAPRPADAAGGAVLRLDGRRSIPLSELEFETARSSGPGGQNVNKTETKVAVSFRPEASRALDEDAKARIAAALGPRLTVGGAIRIACDRTRSQRQNRAEALDRLRRVLAAVLAPRRVRRPTGPTAGSRERRLRAKRRRSLRKRARGAPGDE